MNKRCDNRDLAGKNFDKLLRSIMVSPKEQTRLNQLAEKMRRQLAGILEANTAADSWCRQNEIVDFEEEMETTQN